MTWHINDTPTKNLQWFAWARVSAWVDHGPVWSDGSRLTEISQRIRKLISEFHNSSIWLFGGYFGSVRSLPEVKMRFVQSVIFTFNDSFPRALWEASTCSFTLSVK